MRALIIRIFLLIVLLQCNALYSQSSDDEAIRVVIDKLFDGMRAGDSSAVSVLFHPDVRMMTSYLDPSGEPVMKEGSLKSFLTAIGTPHPEVWDEKIWNTEVQTDDNLAQVWTDYAFYVDDRFSHCGVDAFQLIKGNDGDWKIINLIDTRRKSPCEQP